MSFSDLFVWQKRVTLHHTSPSLMKSQYNFVLHISATFQIFKGLVRMISPHILPWNSAFLDPQTSKVINEDFLNKLIWILFFFGLVVEPTHLKNMVVKLEIFPRFQAENLKIFEKAPPSSFGMHKFWGYNLGGPSRPPKYLLFCRKMTWIHSGIFHHQRCWDRQVTQKKTTCLEKYHNTENLSKT